MEEQLWSRIPINVREDRNLDAEPKVVYSALDSFADSREKIPRGTVRTVSPSLNDLVRRAGMARQTVCNALNDLEEAGYIEKIPGRNGERNKYMLLAPMKGDYRD